MTRREPTSPDTGKAGESGRPLRINGTYGPISFLEHWLPARLPPPFAFGLQWWRSFSDIEGIDRSLGLASRAFISCLPLLIVISALVPLDRHTLQDTLWHKMGLSESATEAVRQLLAPREEIRNQLTLIGCALLLFSAVSFMRRLQQLYERVWELPRLGARGTGWGVGGLSLLVLFFIIVGVSGALIRHFPASGLISIAISLAVGCALWLNVPYILLARRVALRRLVPGALVTAVAMAALSVWMSIYMPQSISSQTRLFGPVGVVFAIVYWFVAVACVIVGAAVAGRILDRRAGAQDSTG